MSPKSAKITWTLLRNVGEFQKSKKQQFCPFSPFCIKNHCFQPSSPPPFPWLRNIWTTPDVSVCVRCFFACLQRSLWTHDVSLTWKSINFSFFFNFLINDQLTTEIVIFVRTGVGVTSTGLLISNQGGRWWSGQSGQSRPGSIYHHTPPVTCAQSRQSTSLVTDQVTSLAKSKYYTTLIGTLWKQFKGLAILRIHIPKFYVVLGIAWLVHWMGT